MEKSILFGIYRPLSQNASYFLHELGKAIDHYSRRCKNFVAFDDSNIEEGQEEMKGFMEIFHLKNLIKVPTCVFSVR